MNRLSLTATGMIALISAVSCSLPKEHGEFKPVDASGWLYNDTLSFAVVTGDSVSTGDLAIAVRHSADYDYSNLWLEVTAPVNGVVRRDTVNLALADVYGRWLGKGLGLSYQRVDTIARGVTLSDSSHVSVRHIMRLDRLEGIEQLGVIFRPSGQGDN